MTGAIKGSSREKLIKIDYILYGSDQLDDKKSCNILIFTINFTQYSQRFKTNTCYDCLSINVKRICVLFICTSQECYIFF